MIKDVIGFSGFSGSGKTVLIGKIISLLKKQHLKIAVIKHDGHDLNFDHEGRDTWIYQAAGADIVIASSRYRNFMTENKERSLFEMIVRAEDADIVLVEGFKYGNIPQIGVTSARTGYKLPKEAEQYLAVVSDDKCRIPDCGVTYFDISDAENISCFILESFQKGTLRIDVKERPSVGVAVLAGGHSTRMGRPKENVVIPGDGRTMLNRLCDEMSFFRNRYISVRDGQHIDRPDYIPVPDLYKDRGPMGGIFSLLSFCKTDALLVLACDMTGYNRINALRMLDAYSGEDILLPQSVRGPEPLAAIYSKNILPELAKKLEINDHRLRALIETDAFIRIIEDDDIEAYKNVNMPEENI